MQWRIILKTIILMVNTLLLAWLVANPQLVGGQTTELAWQRIGPGHRALDTIPQLKIPQWQQRAIAVDPFGGLPERLSSLAAAAAPYRPLQHQGPMIATPGTDARFALTLSNFSAVTRTYQLTTTLPPQLAFTADLARDGLVYDAAARKLTWQGALAPGNLEMVISQNDVQMPYLDLANFALPNLCTTFLEAGEDCDTAAVTFNLGTAGYTANLYGTPLSQLTVTADGLILGGQTAVFNTAYNQWLPDGQAAGFRLAGLWQDNDLTTDGRWHAAILSGLIQDHDIFYAQWHDAPHRANPDLTTRMAIAVVLDRALTPNPLSGHIFFIYDNISDPTALANLGYTIGLADRTGGRGLTYAYAPAVDASRPPLGLPPTTDTTLHLHPFLFGGDNNYQRTFTYAARVEGQVPQLVPVTAVVASDSPDPAEAFTWATHYLALRHQLYLPGIQADPSGD